MNECIRITQTGYSENIDKDACWSSRWWQVFTSIIHTHFYTHWEGSMIPIYRWKDWDWKIYIRPRPSIWKESPPWSPGSLAPVSLCWAQELTVCGSHPQLWQLCLVTCTTSSKGLLKQDSMYKWSGKGEATGGEGAGLGIWSHHFPKRISPLESLPDWALLSSHIEVTLGKGNGLSTDGRQGLPALLKDTVSQLPVSG